MVKQINYTKLPILWRESLRRWVEDGLHPGGFLGAVLANDLLRAVQFGDDEALRDMVTIVRWLANDAPSGCWGSGSITRAWRGSLMGV